MAAFAANSVLCRLALKAELIDPFAFTAVRVASGTVALAIILALRAGKPPTRGGNWPSALLLFAYALCFSVAYVWLNAATGALILFSLVQATMIVRGLFAGDRPRSGEWAGWALASLGLIWLLLPGLEAPDPLGALLMSVAGVAWGLYSLRGRAESDALGATAGNFLRAALPAALLSTAVLLTGYLSTRGLILAALSGALTSGVGYVIWYAALPSLTSMQAALVQLTVPALAAGGGVLFVAEPLTPRLTVAGLLILGGLALALLRRR